MTPKGIVTMIVVLLLVWGGFSVAVTAAVRRENAKREKGETR
jgi:hypothetical protein